MKNIFKKLFGFLGLVSCSLSFLIGCANTNGNNGIDPEKEDEIITHIIEESDPIATVTNGPFESILTGNREELPDDIKTYSSSTMFDAPRDIVIPVIYDNSENRSLQSISALLNNVVNANDEIHMLGIKDRGGKYKDRTLSTDGKKLFIAAPGGFTYGEVYEIEINDAPYFSFEGKDPQIRKLTIEIEDDPTEAATYDQKVLKNNIVNVDRSKISNKKQDKEFKTYSFDYEGSFPNMAVETIFYATKAGEPNAKFDFYGAFIGKSTTSNGLEHIEYRAPNMYEIYDSFHMKDVQELDFDDAEILVTDDLAKQQFKQSSLARGLVKTLLEITPEDINKIIEILRHINVNIGINRGENIVSLKFSASLNNYRMAEGKYISIEFGYQSTTEYILDFDVKITYDWIFPTGVDYKLKCIEDTQEGYFLKFCFDVRPIEEIPSDNKHIDRLLDNIEKSLEGKSSELDVFQDKDKMGPSSSGTKTTWPLLIVDVHYLTPLQIRIKLDFYIDAGFEIMGLGKYESRSTKVDFNFSNCDGGGQDTATETTESSNIVAYFGGKMFVEAGIRFSIGVSIFGLYDYLHIEGYAEVYINITLSGLLAMDISFKESGTDFSGYIAVDFMVSVGVRAGVNIKFIVFDTNLSYTKSCILFRLKYDNPMEHWADTSADTITMDKETLSLNDTSALRIIYFDSINWTVKEKQYQADDKFSIFSGLLVKNTLQEWTSGNTFEYSTTDPRIEISKNGVIHVKDGTETTFTTQFKVHVNKYAGYISDKTFTINYSASDVKDVYIDGKLIDQQRPGYTITLPEAEKIHGKGFDYYLSDENVRYNPGDRYTLPYRSSSFTAVYHDLPIYRVNFYDPRMNLVAIDDVFEGDDAIAPVGQMRDRYMDESWVFMSWDKPFTNIQKNTFVYGVYMKVN